MIRLADIELPYSPESSVLFQGVHVSKDDAGRIDTTGYNPLVIAGSTDFPLYDCAGLPRPVVYRAWTRKAEDGTIYIAAIEFNVL